MIGKIEISKIEHTLILTATLIIPVITIGIMSYIFSKEVYEYLFPIPPQVIFSTFHGGATSIPSTGEWSAKPTLPIFRYCVFLSLTISFFLLIYKRVVLSLLTFILPALSLVPFVMDIHWRVKELLETVTDAETLNYYGGKSSIEIAFLYFDNLNTILLTSLLILFFWQISILLRMLIKTLQRKPELP